MDSSCHPSIAYGFNMEATALWGLLPVITEPSRWTAWSSPGWPKTGLLRDFPGGASGKNVPANAGFSPWVRKIPWRRKWQPTPVFLPGKIPWTEEPGRLQSTVHRIAKSWTQLKLLFTWDYSNWPPVLWDLPLIWSRFSEPPSSLRFILTKLAFSLFPKVSDTLFTFASSFSF